MYSPCLDHEACLTNMTIVDSEKTAPYVCLQGQGNVENGSLEMINLGLSMFTEMSNNHGPFSLTVGPTGK